MGELVNLDERRGPANSVTLDDGNRFYIFNEGTDQEERFWSVTTATGIMDKDGIPRWTAGLAADAAFAELPRVVAASRRRPCGNTYNRCKNREHDWRETCPRCPCGTCKTCLRRELADTAERQRNRRADEGREVHDVIEEWVLSGGTVKPHSPQAAPYVKQFLRFVKEHGLTPESWLMSEATVVNRKHQYAGTLDGIVVAQADAAALAAELVALVLGLPLSQVAGRSATVLFDTKTRENEEARLYHEMPLQLTAYRNAEVVRIKRTGAEEPMPPVDGVVLVQLLPEDYHRQPLVSDEEEFEAFLRALGLFRWRAERGTASISRKLLHLPKEPKPAKTTARKAAAPRKAATRKATAKAAAPAAASRPAATAVKDRPHMDRLLGLPTPHPDSPYGDEIPF